MSIRLKLTEPRWSPSTVRPYTSLSGDREAGLMLTPRLGKQVLPPLMNSSMHLRWQALRFRDSPTQGPPEHLFPGLGTAGGRLFICLLVYPPLEYK